MKKQTIIVGTILAVSAAVPVTAMARPGFATTDVHMRAGPSTDMPVVTTVDGGDRVDIRGCLDGYNWCDVIWGGQRGWIYSDYLRLAYEGRHVRVPRFGARIDLPVISFAFGDYWDRHYRDRDWHHRRDYWRGRWARHHRDGDRDRRDHDRAGRERDRDHGRNAGRGDHERDHGRKARRGDYDRDHGHNARRGDHDQDQGRDAGRRHRDGDHDRRAGGHDRNRGEHHGRREEAESGLKIELGPGGVNIR